MKVLMKSVDMICFNTKDGKITPVKFRINDKTGENMVINIGKILERSEEKLAGNRMLLYKIESIIDGMQKIYEMKYEIESCKWYIYKM